MNFRGALRAVLPAVRPPVREGAAKNVDQESLRGDLDKIRRTVAAIPNTSTHFPTRESYLHIGYAIKASLGDTPEAFDLFLDWCGRWHDGVNDPDDVLADWRRMKPEFKRGANWLYELAEKLGDGSYSPLGEKWFQPPVEPLFGPEPVGVEGGRPPLVANRIDPAALLAIPPRRWLYGTKLQRGFVTMIASPGGVGKTTFSIAVALALASGRTLLHDRPHRPMRVWRLHLEDPQQEELRRVAAAMRRHELDAAVLDNLRSNSGRDRQFCIVAQSPDGQRVVQPDFAAVIAEVRREDIGLLIVEPVLRSHSVPENDNEAQDDVLRLYAQVADEGDCAVMLIAHTRKGAERGELDSVRGGSTQGGGARVVLTMSPMVPEEAKSFGIPEERRRRYVRIDDAKQNMSPAQGAEWIFLDSVLLGNGSEEYPSGDNVQAAVKWDVPTARDALADEDGDTSTMEALLLGSIDAGPGGGERYSGRPQDRERWAGEMIMTRCACTESQAKELLKDWHRRGMTETKAYSSPSQRKERQGLFVVGKKGSGSVFD